MEENRVSMEKPGKEGHYVPEHIVHEILLRLPTKSLVRFKSVCKNWRNTISDPGFEDINFQKLLSNIRIVYNNISSRVQINGYSNRKKHHKGKKVTSLCFQSKHKVEVEKLCNILVLFQSRSHCSRQSILFLYDTITHQQKLLPEMPKLDDVSPLDDFRICNSLLFDASRQTYKVVAFNYDAKYKIVLMCYIYNSNLQNWKKKEHWKKSKPPRPQKLWLDYFSTIALNGIFYWIAQAIPTPLRPPKVFLQPMNIATEEFMETIKVPFCRPTSCSLVEIKRSIFLTIASSLDELQIWVLKDSVQSIWINQYKIWSSSIMNRPATLRTVQIDFTPMLFAESYNNTTAYILAHHWGKLYWYGMDTQEIKLIDVESESGCRCYARTVSFIE